jgi:hypothetical protein
MRGTIQLTRARRTSEVNYFSVIAWRMLCLAQFHSNQPRSFLIRPSQAKARSIAFVDKELLLR